jgi:quinoprotein glucose dehydrogenase
MNRRSTLGVAVLGTLVAAGAAVRMTGLSAQSNAQATEWKYWGGDVAQTHFSPLTQLTPANVAQLKPVWVYNPGTTGRGWENTPLLIDGLLYVSDPTGDIVALDPVNGDPVWRWKSPTVVSRVRGLAYWAGDGTMKPRLIAARAGRILGLDLKTGVPVTDWPNGGFNFGYPQADGSISVGGTNSSPPLVFKNMIVSVAGDFTPGGNGGPRAFDLRTGKLLWHTRLVPEPGQPGADSWGRNVQEIAGGGGWGIASADEASGTIFLGTDSPGQNYVGLWRPGDNKWANSTVAIDAETGRLKWAFQTHHHDVFDWDTMAAPSFTTITRNGERVPVVVQTTKLGMVWIFDARTGQPIHDYEEKPVAQSLISGEKTAATQPFTINPPPLGKMSVTRDEITRITPQSHAECAEQWDRLQMQNAGPFTPPYPTGMTVYLPGSSGAINWGGATVNPETGITFTNVTNIPVYNGMRQNVPGAAGGRGQAAGRAGGAGRGGRGGGGGGGGEGEGGGGGGGGRGSTVDNQGWVTEGNFTRWADRFGRPCIPPPHGELFAIEIATGKIVWRVPLGTLEDDYGAAGKDVGATNIGPSVATRSGLLFIGATADERFRAFDQRTGRKLWEAKMSASGVAGPMTYIGRDGRQYVVIAAGGPGTAAYRTNPQWGYRQTLVAFAIPRPGERVLDIVTPYPKRMPIGPEETWTAQ